MKYVLFMQSWQYKSIFIYKRQTSKSWHISEEKIEGQHKKSSFTRHSTFLRHKFLSFHFDVFIFMQRNFTLYVQPIKKGGFQLRTTL